MPHTNNKEVEIKQPMQTNIDTIVEEYKEMVKGTAHRPLEDWLRTTLTQLSQQQEEMTARVGMLRQWLNEDRITDSSRMVTNEQIMYWLTGDESHLAQTRGIDISDKK